MDLVCIPYFAGINRAGLARIEQAAHRRTYQAGADIFAEHTAQNIGTYLAIVLDKVVISAPVIHSAIPDGQGIIQGNFTRESAEELAALMYSAPLPIPITPVPDGDGAMRPDDVFEVTWHFRAP